MENQQTVGIVAKNSVSYVAEIFNCYQKNQVVVLLRDNNDSRIESTNISKVIEPDESKGWFTSNFKFSDDSSLAQISFTSGTEGEPKGVLLLHKALSDVTKRLNDVMEVDASIREYVGVPANFSFGLGRFRAVSAIGGHAYLPENGFDPLEIRDMLKAGEINAISAVPSLWRILLKNKSIFAEECSDLKWIEIGSQYMSKGEKEELKSLFPKAIIAQHYGLTEASRTTFLRIDKTSGDSLESVGKAYGDTEFKISDAGRICIRGPHVADTLLKNGINVSNVDSDGWFETSDLGYVENEYLFYKGRADDLINCSGIKLSPDALERDLREKLAIKEGIAVGAVNDDLTGNAVLIATLEGLPVSDDQIHQAAHEVLLKYGVNNKNVIKRIMLETFPMTTTNKVKRKDLAKKYCDVSATRLQNKESISVESVIDGSMTEDEEKISKIWQETLKIEHIDINTNFYDLGGDSLSAIGALIEMERKGVPSDISKGMLQGLSISEIAQRLQTSSVKQQIGHQIRTAKIRSSMAINIIRGLMVLAVILAHWHQGVIERLPFGNPEGITQFLAPLLAIGTPGFAIIYGVGAGYALFPIFKSDPERLRHLLKKTFLVLLVGIVLQGLVEFWAIYELREHVTFTDFTNSFFSVLTYYLLATISLYGWFKLISRYRYPSAVALLISIILYSIHVFLISKLAVYKAEGLIEFGKLLLTAKYAYFLMFSGTLIGMSIGLYIESLIKDKQNLNVFYVIGATVLILGVVFSIHAGATSEWSVWPIKSNYMWRWLVYTGFILILLAWFDRLLMGYNKASQIQKIIMQFLSVIGMLAFPLFVLHEMVIPLKSLMVSYDVPVAYALPIATALFLYVSYSLFRKLHRSSFL